MARRVFEIAKDLEVASKAIVEKCHAEGIPEDVIKNHMSSVSVGLEATIRDWFTQSTTADDSGGGTAVETAAKVDIDKVRARPRKTLPAKAVARKAGDDQQDSGEPTAGAEGHAGVTEQAVGQADEGASEGAGDRSHGDELIHAHHDQNSSQSEEAASVSTQPQRATQTPTTPAARAPSSMEVSFAAYQSSAAGQAEAQRTTEARDAREARDTQDASDQQVNPAASAGSPTADSSPPAAPAAPRLPKITSTQSPAPMNVPTRPDVVKPAGPQLQQKQQVKLSGPKVVRVEAPERLEAPRRRPPGEFAGGGGGGGGGGGRGAGGGYGGPGGDDASRGGAPRRGPGGAPAKRRGPAGPATQQEQDAAADRKRGRDEWTGNIFSEADLAEREARLQRSGGYLKQRRQLARRGGVAGADPRQSLAQTGGKVAISAPFTIKDLSAATGVKAAEIVKKLFLQGVAATANSGIDVEKAQEIMFEYNIELDVQAARSAEEVVTEEFGQRDTVDERRRGPVVTILGHVDHGKTSLLDRIRNANVAAGEAGGITQATSAFRVPVHVGEAEKHVVFIDTPGHAAFTEMRSRGANVTDICVIVVAADDGVMPQTIESISHAQAAGTPIVVALNKIDKAEATDSNIQRILGQLAERGLNPAEWGGETEVVRTSAVKDIGIQELLEMLDYQAELLELKADFGGPARGSVIESKTEQGRGVVANVLISDGQLKVGDFVVAGRGFGRVRDITDDRGQKLKAVQPPSPVQISGLDQIPDAGDPFYVVDSLKKAQEAAEQRRQRDREAQLAQPKVTLDSLLSQMQNVGLKEILIVLKADVQGSIDVLKNEVEKVSTSEVKIRVLHGAVGGITESDVLLAEASKAIIIGFNVIASGKARSMAESKGVEIRNYDVIYHITEDIKKAAEGLLEPELRQEVLGHADVRQVFRVSKVGMIAGCYVTDGVIERDALIRVTRNGIVIEKDRKLSQLKRFKDDAKEVRNGMECGMKIDGYDDIKAGDVLECYKQVQVKRSL